MNNCLCIKHTIRLSSINRLAPSDCNYECEDDSDNIYSGDCGGEVAYNIYETQGGTLYIFWCTSDYILPLGIVYWILFFLVMFNSEERCLSLQCSEIDKRFIPQKCSKSLDRVCENMREFYWNHLLVYAIYELCNYWIERAETSLVNLLISFKKKHFFCFCRKTGLWLCQ